MRNTRIRAVEVKGHCSAGIKAGDGFTLVDGTVISDVEGPLCLYALNAVSGYLTGKAFSQPGSGWIQDVKRLQCPDVANAVVFEISDAQ